MRVRQFSNIRQSRSRVSSLNQSQFAVSRKLNFNQQTPTAKFTTTQTKMRESNASSRSEYVCINCVNHSLCEARKQTSKKEKEELRQAEKQLLKNYDTEWMGNNRNQSQILMKSTLQYNQKLIKQHQKIQRKLFQQEQNEKIAINHQEYKFKQKLHNDHINEEYRKQKWRKEIQQQIQQKKQKNLEKMSEIKNLKNQLEFVDAQKMQSWRKKLQDKYRNDLLRQIKENSLIKDKQKRQKQIEASNKTFALVQAAHERERKQNDLKEEKKRQLLEEARQTFEESERKKFISRQEIENQRKEIQKEEINEQHLNSQRKKIKEDQLNKYLKEIKQQMKVNKQKKFAEIQDRYRKVNTTLDFQVRDRAQKECKSCDKKFPKTFMTKVKG